MAAAGAERSLGRRARCGADAGAVAATAHVRKAAGSFRVELGWADEPAYAGARNAVEVRIADGAGAPLGVRRALGERARRSATRARRCASRCASAKLGAS